MDSIGKSFALILILLMTLSSLSLLLIKPAFAQSLPKPSVPEFTVKLADHSYDVPQNTTSTTDPYTNQTITITIPSYHVQNLTIDVTIKNQPFPSVVNGNKTNLYYFVQLKPHFGEVWTGQYPYAGLYPQSSSQYTVMSFNASYQPGDEIDFHAEAILGYDYVYTFDYYDHGRLLQSGPQLTFVNQTSDWSPTQTFTMPASSSSTSPTSTPTVPEFPTLIVLPLFAIIILLSIIFLRKLETNDSRIPNSCFSSQVFSEQ